MNAKRWNDFIYAVNNNLPIESINPPVENENEVRIFNNMVKELARMRESRPQAAFYPVEKEDE